MSLYYSLRSAVLVFLTSVALLVAAAPRRADSFALIGPNRIEVDHTNGDHALADPAQGHFQSFGAGFRWSTSELTYAFDQSFIDAFGPMGKQAVVGAFATWDAAYALQNAPFNTGVQTKRMVGDLQSIALHEIGHALGLHHPDMAGNSAKNFDKNGNLALVNVEAVMHSKLNVGEVQRALTIDDVEGLQYLYNPQTMIPTLSAPNQMIQTAGPGDPDFKEAGQAAIGGTTGAHFDLFAMDLGASTPGARTLMYGGAGVGGNLGFQNQEMGGFFDGMPIAFVNFDNASHGRSLKSLDIIFNTNTDAKLGVNPAPEPASYLLATIALTGLIAFRRRQWSAWQLKAENSFSAAR